METNRYCPSLALAALTVILAGCSNAPPRVEAPAWDPAAAADKALELYDSDGDGAIGGGELDAVPSFKVVLASMDTDGDGKLSKDEIKSRFDRYVENRLGLMSVSCAVMNRNRPVPGATVLFEPEPFCADLVGPAKGITGPDGSAIILTEGEQDGMKVGFYKVRISVMQGGKEKIKAKYNTETILGQEISLQNQQLAMGPLVFQVN